MPSGGDESAKCGGLSLGRLSLELVGGDVERLSQPFDGFGAGDAALFEVTDGIAGDAGGVGQPGLREAAGEAQIAEAGSREERRRARHVHRQGIRARHQFGRRSAIDGHLLECSVSSDELLTVYCRGS